METNAIIAQIDAEIKQLQAAKAVLLNGIIKRGPKPSARTAAPKKRTMSAEGRARIAAAQKARWAKAKRATRAA